MATETIVFPHARRDSVKIKLNGVKAKVLALNKDEDGTIQFLCRYANKTDAICEHWLREHDIEDWTD